MSRAEGAPGGDLAAYMAGIAERVARASPKAPRIERDDPVAFLESLRDAGLLRLEERGEASSDRVDPKTLLDEGPVAFGENVALEDLERDVFDRDDA